MQKVPLTSWGGTKVRNRMKSLWPLAGQDEQLADADFGQYQQSLATTVQNANELIDEVGALKSDNAQIKAVLDRRPF